jgi:hypothetical protein
MTPIPARTNTETDEAPVPTRFQPMRFIPQAIDRLILHDLRALLSPGQPPAPLVAAAILGTLLSFIPAPFVDTLLLGLIITRFKKVNRSALLAARFLWNDLVVLPLYVPGFRFGMSLLEPRVANSSAPPTQAAAFLLGLFALTLAAACMSAVMMFSFVTLLRYWHGSKINGMMMQSRQSTQGRAHRTAVSTRDFQRQSA